MKPTTAAAPTRAPTAIPALAEEVRPVEAVDSEELDEPEEAEELEELEELLLLLEVEAAESPVDSAAGLEADEVPSLASLVEVAVDDAWYVLAV